MRHIATFMKILGLCAVMAAPVIGAGCDSCIRGPSCPVCVTETVVVAAAPAEVCDSGVTYQPAGPYTVVPQPIHSDADIVAVSASAPAFKAQPAASAAPVMKKKAKPAVVAAKPAAKAPTAKAPAVVSTPIQPIESDEAPVAVVAAPKQAPVGEAIYFTPGGTPVATYVPGPSAAVRQKGPINANVRQFYGSPQPAGSNVHYTTGAIVEVRPEDGESVVWSSGF